MGTRSICRGDGSPSHGDQGVTTYLMLFGPAHGGTKSKAERLKVGARCGWGAADDGELKHTCTEIQTRSRLKGGETRQKAGRIPGLKLLMRTRVVELENPTTATPRPKDDEATM